MALVHEAVAEELRRQGNSVVFGLIGDDVLKLGAALHRAGVGYYATRHESAAVSMADGYARVSGRVGVAVVSRGPGLTNALTAITVAARARSRVLIITSESEPALRGVVYSKWVDQPILLAGVEVDHVTLDNTETAAADFEMIYKRVRAGGGPIVASFRGTVLDETAGNSCSSLSLTWPTTVEPRTDEIRYVVDLLSESWAFRRPVILAGRGAVSSGACSDLGRVARACGALLTTTLMARALFEGDEFDIGVCGTFSTEVAVELLREADLVLAFGASLGVYTTLNGAIFPDARVFQIESDDAARGRGSVSPELFVHADAGLAARAIADELERREHHAVGFRNAMTAERLAASTPRRISDEGRPGALDPRVAMQRIEEVLPPDKVVVVDTGHHMAFAGESLSVTRPHDFLCPLEYYSIGTATGLALGAAVANRDRLTVYAAGDGGLMMSLPEIETAARYGLKLLVLVTNDSAFGAELHLLRRWRLADDIARDATPAFEAVARALGGSGLTIRNLADIELLGERVTQLSGPLIVDIPVTTDVRAEAYFLEEDALFRNQAVSSSERLR